MLLNVSSIRLGNGNAGGGLLIICQVHIDDAGLIVADHSGNGPQTHGNFRLLIEGGGATGAENHLAGYVNSGVVFRLANASDEYIVQRRTASIGRGVQARKGLVRVVSLIVDKILTGYAEAVANGAVVIHRSNGEGVGVGAGGTAGVEVHIVTIERTGHRLAVLGPVAVVAGGNADHRVGLHQRVQQALVRAIGGHTGIGRTQRQVHGVAVQNDGVLDGSHVVRVVCAAAIAEHLHHNQLGIRCIAHYADCVPSGNILLAPLQVAVGRCNACHMGAMLALVVVVMGHIQVLVNVAEAKGGFQVYVQIRSRETAVPGGSVQLRQGLGDLLLIQHIQGLQILFIVHTGITGILCQSHCQGQGIKRLMIGIETGVDDGNPGAGAGVTGFPGTVGAGHLGGNQHVGLRCSVGGGLLGLIPSLQNHILDAGKLPNLLNLPIGHISGNDIGRQGQVPCHIQLFANGLLNGCGHVCLLTLQAGAVGHGLLVFPNVHSGEARLNGGLLVQHDGHTDNLCVGIVRSIRFFLRNALL